MLHCTEEVGAIVDDTPLLPALSALRCSRLDILIHRPGEPQQSEELRES